MISSGQLAIDPERYLVTVGGQSVHLTYLEFNALWAIVAWLLPAVPLIVALAIVSWPLPPAVTGASTVADPGGEPPQVLSGVFPPLGTRDLPRSDRGGSDRRPAPASSRASRHRRPPPARIRG